MVNLERYYPVIKRSLFTEKVTKMQAASNTWAFEVRPDANKIEVRQAVEAIFGVKVLAVRTAKVQGKIKRVGFGHGRTADWKKAFVTLKEGDTIGQI